MKAFSTFLATALLIFSFSTVAQATASGCEVQAKAAAVRDHLANRYPDLKMLADTDNDVIQFYSYIGDIYVNEVKPNGGIYEFSIEFFEQSAWDGGSEDLPATYYRVDVDIYNNCKVESVNLL